jgi:hypothetical protein
VAVTASFQTNDFFPDKRAAPYSIAMTRKRVRIRPHWRSVLYALSNRERELRIARMTRKESVDDSGDHYGGRREKWRGISETAVPRARLGRDKHINRR